MSHNGEPLTASAKGVSNPFILDSRLGALANCVLGVAGGESGQSLLALHRGLLTHYFRLEEAERRLASQVRLGRGGRTIRQVELERQRLSRELHTGVGQMLAAIRLQIEMIGALLLQPPAPAREALDRVARLARDAMEQVRSLSLRLHPPEWQRLTLDAALRQLWELSGIPQKFESSLRIEPLPRQLNLEFKILIYRSAQEALSNIARHSQATRVEASLETRGSRLVLTVRDNGSGFDAAGLLSSPARLNAGLGLRSIREQAAALGGRLRVESGPNGTTLELQAPFARIAGIPRP